VFEFINAHELPADFKVAMPWSDDVKAATVKRASATAPSAENLQKRPQQTRDVDRDDLMNVKRSTKDDNLPQMVRDYILHDRGNSIFLGDSFGNLPSPVGESATIRKLFKFNEDEVQDKRRKNESKNQAIRIEGKKEKGEDKPKHVPDRVPPKGLKIDLQEIERIVFEDTVKAQVKAAPQKEPARAPAGYRSIDKSINQSRQSIKPYEEEESYENPVNISKAPCCQEEYIDIRSEYAHAGAAVNLSMNINTSQDEGFIQISNLQIDENMHDSYQIISTSANHGLKVGRAGKNLGAKQLSGYSPKDISDSKNNTIKLIKEDIVIGGQVNPNVKITRQGKGIRIG